jgi:hypothetical protein
MMQNPRVENFSLNNQEISPKETLVGATWAAAFGQEQILIVLI